MINNGFKKKSHKTANNKHMKYRRRPACRQYVSKAVMNKRVTSARERKEFYERNH
jgi:hypothetical protein